jgi:hypothetical protein
MKSYFARHSMINVAQVGDWREVKSARRQRMALAARRQRKESKHSGSMLRSLAFTFTHSIH